MRSRYLLLSNISIGKLTMWIRLMRGLAREFRSMLFTENYVHLRSRVQGTRELLNRQSIQMGF